MVLCEIHRLVGDAQRKQNEEKCFRHRNDFVKHLVMSERRRPYIGIRKPVKQYNHNTNTHMRLFSARIHRKCSQTHLSNSLYLLNLCIATRANERERERNGTGTADIDYNRHY